MKDANAGFLVDFVNRHRMARKDDSSRKKPTATTPMTIALPCFLVGSLGHAGNCSSEIPPQSFLFPESEIALVFRKIPSVGTSTSKLLEDI